MLNYQDAALYQSYDRGGKTTMERRIGGYVGDLQSNSPSTQLLHD